MAGTQESLEGKRILVIGASSGVGRASADALVAEGARVAYAARRRDRIEASAAAAADRAIAVPCDVTDEASVKAAVAQTLEAFGGLDALVYAPGIAAFSPIAEVDAETWRAVLDANLVGPSIAIRAAIGALEASRGKVVLFSSICIDDSPPRPQNGPYVVSKVALESLVRAWQGEHRSVGFTTLALGDTLTEFGQDGDVSKLGPMVRTWFERDYMYGRVMDADSVAVQVVSILRSRETVRRVAMTPRYADEGSEGGLSW